MFICGICGTLTKPRAKAHRHVELRTVVNTLATEWNGIVPERTEIVREVLCCGECANMLRAGMPVALTKRNRIKHANPPVPRSERGYIRPNQARPRFKLEKPGDPPHEGPAHTRNTHYYAS